MGQQRGAASTRDGPCCINILYHIWCGPPDAYKPPASVELTPRQDILFSDPGDPHRFFPSLFEGFESEPAL